MYFRLLPPGPQRERKIAARKMDPLVSSSSLFIRCFLIFFEIVKYLTDHIYSCQQLGFSGLLFSSSLYSRITWQCAADNKDSSFHVDCTGCCIFLKLFVNHDIKYESNKRTRSMEFVSSRSILLVSADLPAWLGAIFRTARSKYVLRYIHYPCHSFTIKFNSCTVRTGCQLWH
jgi:hypothetical protein